MYIKHDFIKDRSLEYREYQVSIATNALKESTLVVIPTGMGKTVIALLVMVERLKRRGGKILFLAPTKPLVLQHLNFLREHLTIDDQKIVQFTGEMSPRKREKMWKEAVIVVSTPQVIENDINSGRIELSDVSLIIFDEAHRAVGGYSYVFVAESYREQCKDRLVLGITASPGSEIERILEVCRNLGITNIEIRTSHDPDVKPYVHDIKFIWKRIDLPKEFKKVIELLREALSERLKILREEGLLNTASISRISRKKLLDIQTALQSAIEEGRGNKDRLFKLLILENEAIKLYHGIELLQTQGVKAAKSYFQRMRKEAESRSGSKASKVLMRDHRIIEALAYLNTLNIDHPKIDHVVNVVKEQFQNKPDSRVIVFTHYRDTSLQVEEALKKCNLIKPRRFIGQAMREEEKGMSQKEQAEIIEKFKKGIYNTLVATSVAEEGIDIPSTDMVVFYEPIPSEIRTIQRRGRTARRMAGKVVILITKNTADEGYYWAAIRKEKRMRRELEYLKREIKKKVKKVYSLPQQKKLTDFA